MYFERLLSDKCVYCGEDAVRKWKPSKYHPETEYPICSMHLVEHLEEEMVEIRNWLKNLVNTLNIQAEKLDWLLGV